MKEYILINRVPAGYTGADAQEVIQQWNALSGKWKEDGIFVSSFVFPSAGFVISNKGALIQNETVITSGLKIVSAIVVKATDYDEAIALAKGCPTLEQDGTVEVVETFTRPAVAKN